MKRRTPRPLADKLAFAARLRSRPTRHERLLDSALREAGYFPHFTTQEVVAGYIVDFWFPAERLAVEVDGPSHRQQRKYDALRTKHIARCDARVMRVNNGQVSKSMPEVLDLIARRLPVERPESYPDPLPENAHIRSIIGEPIMAYNRREE